MASGQKLLAYIVFFTPMVLMVSTWTPNKFKVKADLYTKKTSFVFAIFLLLLIIGQFKTVNYPFNSMVRFLHLLFFLVIFSMAMRKYFMFFAGHVQAPPIYYDLFISLLIFLLLNIFAYYVVGIVAPSGRGTVVPLQSRFFLTPFRIFFPFTVNSRAFSQDIGASLILATHLILLPKRQKHKMSLIVYTVVVLAVVISIMLADARMTLLASIIFSILLIVLNKSQIRIGAFRIIFPVIILFPLLYFLILTLNKTNVNLNDDFITLNNRLFFWSAATLGLSKLSLGTFLFGYGIYSHKLSGVTQSYQFIFERTIADLTNITYHNAVFQYLYDIGIVGLAVVIIFCIRTAHNPIYKVYDRTDKILELNKNTSIVLILYYLALGITESMTPYYYPTVIIVFIIVHYYTVYQNNALNQLAIEKKT